MTATTTQQRYDWQTEEQIAEQEFADGYHVERDRRTPERDGSNDALEHDQNEGNPNATTMYGGRSSNGYDPNERLPACERWATKGDKFASLWARNAGVDSHRAPRRSRAECNKANERTKDRQRFVQAVANALRLGEDATERAKELATLPTPKTLNFIGGLDTWLLAVTLHAANEQRTVMRVDRDALKEIRADWGVTTDQLATATEKVANIVRKGA
ncbi:hypothetical protein BRC81_04710 [Halobacteriales archaeon QS_1_68_20]|nr:MAG: hypothetical protein BRC81_04710 [Halobacteriales archaeon QS_1_68_20]